MEQMLPKNQSWQKKTAFFLGSQTISLFGSYIVQYAISWHITLTAKSGVWMTFAILFGFLPTFFLAPFGGVWADRMNRKHLIMLADGFIAVSTFLVALLYGLGQKSLWLLLAASAIRAMGAAFHSPAVSAILPQIVPENQILRVNGINATIQSVVGLVSPVVAAGLLSILPLEWIFLVDVLTAALAIAILGFFLKVPTHLKADAEQPGKYFQDLRMGIRYIGQHTFVRKLYAYFAIAYLFVGPVSFLTPLQVARSYGEEYFLLTAIEVSFAVGMLVGGLLISALGGIFKNRVFSICISLLLMSVCTVGLGLAPPFWLYCALMFGFGIVLPLLTAPTTSLLQEKVEGDYLGRVFGVMTMLSTSMMPLGMLAFGPLADIVAIEWLLILSGVVLIALSLFMLADKKFLSVGKPG